MRRIHWHRGIVFFIVLFIAGASVTACSLVDNLDEALYPTETPAPTSPYPVEQATKEVGLPATPAATFTWPAPTHTPVPAVTEEPTPAPEPAGGQHLIFAHGGGIYRADSFGQDPVEVASVPQLEATAFQDGWLALAVGNRLDIIDLNAGQLYQFRVPLEATVAYSQVRWGTTGRAVLYAAIVEDLTASTFERSVELRAVDPVGGEIVGRAMLHDATGVNLLRYNDETNQALLIPAGGDPSFVKAEMYDLDSGDVVRTLEVQGAGEANLSPDGRYLLTETFDTEGRALYLYDLSADPVTNQVVAEYSQEAYTTSYVWSSAGQRAAFLWLNQSEQNAIEQPGVWVIEGIGSDAPATRFVLEERSSSSSLVDWTPDDAYIVGHHRGGVEGQYYYAVRPDGGDRQILRIDAESQVLGWMGYREGPLPEKVVIDPWQSRFLDAQGDPQALADVVAQYVAANIRTDVAQLVEQVRGHLQKADWEMGASQIQIMSLKEDLFLAQLPPAGIYTLRSGEARQIASGHIILDARLIEDELGLIFGIYSGQQIQPTYLLLKEQEGGAWVPFWSPQGRRDWVATDGKITFAGEGLQTLTVRGSSIGLDVGENLVFVECRECPHRWLSATWTRDEDGSYSRESSQPADAPLASIYWEMTEISPYALLYESLRRMRQGITAEGLATARAQEQAEQHGLLDPTVRLVPEKETPQSVRFGVVDSDARYVAHVQGGKIAHIERTEP